LFWKTGQFAIGSQRAWPFLQDIPRSKAAFESHFHQLQSTQSGIEPARLQHGWGICVSSLFITTAAQLAEYCAELATAPVIAFDTEFVSEHSYRSELCLIQVAALEKLAVIDPLAVGDVRPFWDLIVAPGHETIVHAGREELNFCLHATGKRPANLFDVQLAAGFVSYEYPAGYASLLNRMLGITLEKGETAPIGAAAR